MNRLAGVFTVLVSVLGVITFLVGCSAEPVHAGNERGSWLVVQDRDVESGRFMRFEVDGEGELRVGSGREAQRDEASELVLLDASDLEALGIAMKAAGWLGDEPPRSRGTGPRRLEVSLHWGGERRRFTELADGRAFSSGTTAVLDELVGYARRRFGGVLDGLPTGR